MKNLIIILSLFVLCGCETLYTGLDNVDYQQELSDIEHQYQEGKISYQEYQEAKRNLADSYAPQSHVGTVKDSDDN